MSDEPTADISMSFNSVSQDVKLFWSGIAEVKWQGKSLSLFVTCPSSIEDRTSAAEAAWERRLAHATATGLQSFSAFRINRVRCTESDVIPEPPFSTELTSDNCRQLDNELAHVLRVKTDFERAVAYLRDFAQSPPYNRASTEARRMYSYLSLCLFDCGCLGLMTMWYREKMATISRSIGELSKRQQRNHQGYRFAQDQMRQSLYSFQLPKAWWQIPPTLD